MATSELTTAPVAPAPATLVAASLAATSQAVASLEVASLGIAGGSGGGGGVASQAGGPNRIVLENLKQGTPHEIWQLPNGQDSTTIQGFTTQISTNVGQTVDFKINTASAHYRIDVYRLGYYGGDGARLVGSIERNLGTAQIQPTAIVDAKTGAVDAGNWQVSGSWTVPTDAVSGLYVANLVREDGTAGVSQIPFVVRDESSHSDIVFQTSDQTWQAYNGWGGANLYGGNGPGPGGAAYAVSYNRPIVTGDPGGGVDAGPQDTPLGVEYASIQWLEQNGYDVSYLSGVDVSGNGALLRTHKVYMDAGHDEYWTGSQRANVEAARGAGVNLAFLSGNELYWKTQLAPSLDGSATANRTLVTYKDTHANAPTNPSGEWTGTWADPRFVAGNPSNALTGTTFQVDAFRSDTIKIPYAQTQLRVWRNSAVAGTAAGQTASLAAGLLGYEWDASPDNGFRPAGLIALSSTTLAVGTKLLDYGNTTGPGTATHNLVEYRDPISGALVFGAGTVYWSWGLSDDHSFGSPMSDSSVQQATVNFLADMGVQPGTLQATLVAAAQSTDRTAATSAITSLSATSVTEGQQITVVGTAADVGGRVAGVEVSSDGGATWHPASGTTSWSYTFTTAAPGTATVLSRATDDSLNTERPGAGAGVAYTVGVAQALSLFATGDTPSQLAVNDANSVELGMRFTSATNGQITGFRFYKSAQDIGTHTAHLWSATGTLLASATFGAETASGWQQVSLASGVRISAGTSYVVSYHTAGKSYVASDFYWDAPAHVTGSLTAPGNGQNGVYSYGAGSLFPTHVTGANYYADVVFRDTSQGPQANDDSGIAATLNTPLVIAAASLLANDTDPDGYALSITGISNPVGGTAVFDPVAQTITFTPTQGFTGAAGFTYTVSDGHGGSASGLAGLVVEAPASAQSLFYSSDTPATATVADASPVELGVKFRVSVDGAITGLRFYKGPTNTGPHIADLWSSTGVLLATTSFTAETASGWQQISFSRPVAITAGTTYVASYHTLGYYSADAGYFTTAHNHGQLSAPDSASAGGNGVYAYGGGSLFPSNTYGGANYWVDVVFNSTPLLPVAGADSVTATQNTPLTLAAAALLANDTDPFGYALSLSGVGNASHGTVAYDAVGQTVSFTPDAGYLGPAGFTYTIGNGHGGTAQGQVSVAVSVPQPVAGADTVAATEDTPLVMAVATLLANDTDPLGYALSLTGVASATGGTVSFDAAAQTVTFTPAAGTTGPASFTYSVSDGHGGTATGSVGVTVAYPTTAQSLFQTYETPAVASVADPTSVELGVKFSASVTGAITGIKFYKGAANTGPHIADLWSSSGTLLASANFGTETASGWQQVSFSRPVVITAGATYVASYHTNGNYAATAGYFATAHGLGQLSAPDSGSAGGNGVFAYGGAAIFPTASYGATNYWVDVVFSSAAQPPVAADDGVTVLQNSTRVIAASTLLANDSDPYGYPLSITSVGGASGGTVAYDAASQTVSFVAAAGFRGAGGFTYTIGDGHGGSAQAHVAVAVTSAPAPTANNDGGWLALQDTPLTLSVASLLANDTDPNGFALALTGVTAVAGGTVSYDAAAQTVTFTPTAGYVGPASFTYAVDDGHGGTATASVAVAVEPAGTATLFAANATPAIVNANDSSPIEVGLKFQASASGSIAGLRFYKSAANTGPHVINLWSGTGTLLATATVSGETLSGWQTATFAGPVAIAAGTTYVASYHTNGNYSADPGLFATATTSGPLTALASATSGGNGVFAYGSSSLFPTSSYNATSYGVDVIFTPGGAALLAVADNFVTDQNTALSAAASLLANDTLPYAGDTLTVAAVNGAAGNVGRQITLASGALLTVGADGRVSYNPNGRFAALGAGQSATDSFSYTARDAQGATSTATATVTIAGLNDAPVAVADTFSIGQNAILTVAAAAGVLANDTDPDSGDTRTVAAVNGMAASVGSQVTLASGALLTVAADGGLVYNPNGRFATLRLGQTATENFTTTVRDSQGATSTATATVTIAGQAPAGIGFTLAGSFPTLDTAGSLASGVTLGSFAQSGGIAGDSFTYALISGSAAPFSLSAAGVLRTSALVAGAAAGASYTLNVRVLDTTVGASATRTYNVIVGTDAGNTIAVPNTAPAIVFGLQGSDTLAGSGDTVPLWLIAGGNNFAEGVGRASFLTGGAAADVLVGGSGGDTLRGGGGADTLTGGGGADVFQFAAASDSTLAAPDSITDFLHGTDLIDLSGIAGISVYQGRITGPLAAHGFGWVQNGADTTLLANTTGAAEGAAAAQLAVVLRGVNSATLSSLDVRHA